jgi:predicted NUDIX family NTP pyrophosphohydrolase
MAKTSAGLLLHREASGRIEVFLVHPGGPFWARKDEGAWSIPKGEFEEGEDPLEAAKREFREETGVVVTGEFQPLPPLKQRSGKIVYAWMVKADVDPTRLKSNTFSIEWPPRSGRVQEFPEVDQGKWFDLALAKRKILQGQLPFLDQLEARLATPRPGPSEHRKTSSPAISSAKRRKQGTLFD